jgi:hypothetical protein
VAAGVEDEVVVVAEEEEEAAVAAGAAASPVAVGAEGIPVPDRRAAEVSLREGERAAEVILGEGDPRHPPWEVDRQAAWIVAPAVLNVKGCREAERVRPTEPVRWGKRLGPRIARRG